MGFLTLMLFLMALRQTLTLLMGRRSWGLEAGGAASEFPGLLVSVMAALAVVFLDRILTERRRAEDALKRQSRSLLELARHSSVWEGHIAEALQLCTETAASGMEVARVNAWRLTADGTRLERLHHFDRASGRHTDEEVILEREGRVPYFEALGEARQIAVADIHHDHRTRCLSDYAREANVGALLDAPIWFEGRLFGVLCHEHVGGARDWSEVDQHFAAAIADAISLALEAQQKRTVERQLHQSQKMEALGQLTGGVAHDFNNLLTIVHGNLQLLQQTELSPAQKQLVEAALGADERGAQLVRQLLAIGRRSSLQPKVIDLNQIVEDMVPLLVRSLGKAIEIETVLDPDLWPPLLDAGQTENALLNLVINARDAMPDGGKLTIETSRTRLDRSSLHLEARIDDDVPRDYVLLTVQDTGKGMSPEIAAQALEPFFTTKGRDSGSGLGLSMVYGFAKQSGGEIDIQSSPDAGTTVFLYLPRAQGRTV